MIQKAYVVVLLLGSIITVNRADEKPGTGDKKSTANKKIFQPPGNSTIDQIAGTSTPWVIRELIPIIEEHKKNVFEDLRSSPQVKKILGMKTESKETRTILFNILNKYLDHVGHPAPAALANIVSKAMSLFENFSMTTLFETDSITFAEFFLSKNIKIERETATRYVNLLSKALESADTNNKESVLKATLVAYAKFIASYGFNLVDVIDELLILFSSEIIVMYDK